MPIPIILGGIAAASSIAGLVKGGEAFKKNAKAKDIDEYAQKIFDEKMKELDAQRGVTKKNLDRYGELKLNIWDKQFSKFVDLFSSIKNVELEGEVEIDSELSGRLSAEELSEMKQLSLTASEIVSGGVTSLGAGALAGVASYGGAMMFATASTGTAIASLSGVAATNATLAWFGGGSLAAGGLGMAGGTVILGGLVAGPILAVGGLLLASKAKKNLAQANAKLKEAELAIVQMENSIIMLRNISDLTNQYYQLTLSLNTTLDNMLEELKSIIREKEINDVVGFSQKIGNFFKRLLRIKSKIEYSSLTEYEKRFLHATTGLTQLVKVILEKPLLTEEGIVNVSSKEYIEKTDMDKVLEEVINV